MCVNGLSEGSGRSARLEGRAGAARRERGRFGDQDVVVGNHCRQEDCGTATHHVLQRREREAVAAELGGRAVRFGLEMRARMHGHAELGEQERQRQQLDDQATITSNQAGPPQAKSIAMAGLDDNLQLRKSGASGFPPAASPCCQTA